MRRAQAGRRHQVEGLVHDVVGEAGSAIIGQYANRFPDVDPPHHGRAAIEILCVCRA